MAVVVTVTQPGITVTATPTSSGAPASSASAGVIAGIVIGTLLGGVLLIALVLYLLNRYTSYGFTRIANPAHERAATAKGAPDRVPRHPPATGSRRPKSFPRHSRGPSISTEPLMSPASWPPLPITARVRSPGTPSRTDSTSTGMKDMSYDFGEIGQLIASGTVSHPVSPPVREAEETSLRSGTPPYARRTETPSPSASPKEHPKLFVHRMLQSRAQASEGVALVHQPSVEFSRPPTLDSPSFQLDVNQLLADAERTALRDAELAQKGKERMVPDEEDDWEEVESTESIYSQNSASMDHSAFFLDPVSRQTSSASLPRRKSSRKRSRTPVPAPELLPVTEMPDSPRALERQSDARCVSAAGNSSLDGQASHGTASRPMSSVIDHPVAFPLLTSAHFGKGSTMSGTPPGSISSTAGLGSRSSGKTSRYPSLAPSSVLQSSQSGRRSDAGTDWHHPPSGLAGLTSLQIEPLHNPHSPVEEQPEWSDASSTPVSNNPVSDKRARLREGTVGSMPEVERRTVMQGGIAHIDVAL